MSEPHNFFDDIVALATLVSVTCPFDAGSKCEAKWQIDSVSGNDAELEWRVPPAVADQLKVGDVYGIHMRKL